MNPPKNSQPVPPWTIARKLTYSAGVLMLGALACFLASLKAKPDAFKSGSYSADLSLSLKCQTEDANGDLVFVATLANELRRDLNVKVSDKDPHAVIWVKSSRGVWRELLDERYLVLRQTGLWAPPRIRLKAGSTMVWRMKVQELRDAEGNAVNGAELKGGVAYARLNEIAVIPRRGGYISDNALQISRMIAIP